MAAAAHPGLPWRGPQSHDGLLTSNRHPPVAFAYWLTVVLVLALVLGFHFRPETGLTSLIRFGGLREGKLAPELAGIPVFVLRGHHGYDGQYYAHMALHPPWLHHDLASHYDFPSYRMRRIFMPAAAYALGLGRPAWIVHLYPFLNVAAWLALAWMLARWLPPVDWTNFGRWAGCLLAAGTLESIRGALTDLPAILIALGGMRLYEKRRDVPAAGAFAVSVLTRETMALSALGVFWPADASQKTLLRSTLLGLAAVLPLAAWVLYVSGFLPNGGGSHGNFGWPFAAMVQGAADAFAHMAHGTSDNGRYVFRLLTLLSAAVQVGTVLTRRREGPQWVRFSLAFILLYPVLGNAVWEGPWAVWRTELPVTFAFCMMAPAGRWFWPVLLAGSLPSLHALFRLAF